MAVPALDYSRLPAFGLPAPDDEKKDQRGPVTAGLIAGLRGDLQGGLGSAIEGAGKLFGVAPLESAGHAISSNGTAVSQAQRPDLEVAPWQAGGAHVAPWLEYQVARQIPTLAAFIAGGKGLAKAGVEAPAGLQRLGAVTPSVLGGGGLAAGADFATRRAALEAGKHFGQAALGAEVVGIPLSFGSMYQQAQAKPGGATAADAEKAAILAPFHAALNAAEPAQVTGLLSRGLAGNLATRVISAALTGAAAQTVRGGIQSALEQTFRPDLSTSEKMANIVDAAVTGGAVGAAFGGISGVRAIKHADPTTVPNEGLAQTVDAVLGLPSPEVAGRQAPAPNTEMAVDQQGNASPQLNPIDYRQSEFDTARAPRPYESTPVEELHAGLGAAQKAIDAGTASPDVLRFADAAKQELQVRNDSSTTGAVPGETSRGGEPQAEATTGKPEGDGGTDSGAPAPATDWNSERDTLLKGVSTRQRYTDVQSREDLTSAVRSRLEGGSSAAGDFKLAERLGIDTNAPADAPVETAPKSAADEAKPDEQFAAQWKDDVQKLGQRDKGARAIKPVSEADAQQKIYQALGKNTEIGDGLEKLAQKYGILDEEKRLTPLAVDIAAKEPITTEESVKAAMAQGYKGADASMFDRGVRAQLGGEQITKFDNHPDFAAYAAGAKWAEEKNSVPKGALTKYEASRYTGAVTDEQVASMNAPAKEPQARTVTEDAKAKQSANIAIDRAVSPTTQASDLAHLKGMVRDGDVKGAMEGLKRVQAGERLFEQPETEQKPFKGETVTRGAPRTGESTTELQPTRAVSRAAAEVAIRKHEVTQAVHAAHAEGAIDSKERIRLLSKINQGRVADVAAALPTKFTGEKALRETSLIHRTAQREAVRQKLSDLWQQVEAESDNPSELSVDRNGVLRAAKFQGDIHEEAARAVQSQLEGKTALQVTDMLVKNAPSEYHRVVAKKINEVMSYLSKAGMTFDFRVVRAGDTGVPEALHEARGLTHDDAENDVTTIYINGTDGPGATGLSYEVVMHEMLHAVTMQSIGYVEATGKYSSPLGKAVQDLHAVTDAIKAHFSNRQSQGNLSKLEEFIASSNALDDPHEVLAWALSSPEFQSYLDTIDYTPRQTLWGKFVQSMRTFLGLGARGDSALVEVLRASEQIMSVGPQELELAALSGYGGEHAMSAPGVAPRDNDDAKQTIAKVTKSLSTMLDRDAVRGVVRRGALYLANETVIPEHWGKWFDTKLGDRDVNGLEARVAAMDSRHAMSSRLSQMVTTTKDKIDQLEHDNKASHAAINRLMQLTETGIHPLRRWDQQADVVKNSPNAANLRAIWDESQPLVRSLTTKGHIELYNQLRALNDISIMSERATRLHQAVQQDSVAQGRIPEFAIAPMDKFMDHTVSTEMDVDTTHKFWGDELNTQLAAIDKFIQAQRNAADKAATGSERNNILAHASDLEKQAAATRGLFKQLSESPYFHLGRNGDYFVSMRLNKDHPSAMAAAAEHLADFGRVITPENEHGSIYIRVGDMVAQRNLLKAAEQLRAMNVVAPDGKTSGGERDPSIRAGKRDDAKVRNSLSSEWLNRYVERIKGDDTLTKDDRARMIETARSAALDLMPDNSLALVMTKRKSVPGFDPNMYQSFFDRQKVGIDAHVGLAVSPKLTDAYAQMRQAISQAQGDSSDQTSLNKRAGMTDIFNELNRRDHERAGQQRTPALDMIRQASNTWALGLSPAFVAVQLAQPFQITLPKLGSRYGFVQSAKAMSGSTSLAFKVMRAVFSEGLKTSVSRSFDAVIDIKALQKAGVSPAVAEYLMHLANTGQLDIGGPTHELTRAVDGSEESPIGGIQRFASAPGYYAETFTRVLSALAYRSLNPGATERETARGAAQLLKDTMWNYAQDAQGRAFGKSGVLGQYTPLALQFMTYTSQLVQRLYLEMHDAIAGDTPQARQEARKFLMGHAAVTTAFAGTLGLPFATAFAAAFDRLKDLVDGDEEPTNVRASYRQWMASIFGEGVGRVISKGLPNAVGVDLSQRLGEQDIAPFSRFLADRRALKDSLTDLEGRGWGAPAAQATKFVEGMGKLSDGDVMEGMTSILPNSMSAMVKAYSLQQNGYVDGKGRPLPTKDTPGTYTVMAQLLGFNPTTNAEYSEKNRYVQERAGILGRRASNLTNQIVDAVSSGDRETARSLISRARDFERANPGYPVLENLEGTMRSRAKASAVAQATGTPLGTNVKDKGARQLVDY